MIFVDSGAWIGLLNPKDQHYNVAVTIYNRLKNQRVAIVTTDYVIDETITRLRYDVSHLAAVKFLDFINRVEEQNVLTVVSIDSALFQEAVELFRQYDSVRFSFTDCTSFAVCRKNQISEAFAFDEHFAIMEIALLRSYVLNENLHC